MFNACTRELGGTNRVDVARASADASAGPGRRLSRCRRRRLSWSYFLFNNGWVTAYLALGLDLITAYRIFFFFSLALVKLPGLRVFRFKKYYANLHTHTFPTVHVVRMRSLRRGLSMTLAEDKKVLVDCKSIGHLMNIFRYLCEPSIYTLAQLISAPRTLPGYFQIPL